MIDDAISRTRAALEHAYDYDDDDIRALLDEVERLRSALAEAKRDADRYRWMRANWFTLTATYSDDSVQFYTDGPRFLEQPESNIDAAIDAARGA